MNANLSDAIAALHAAYCECEEAALQSLPSTDAVRQEIQRIVNAAATIEHAAITLQHLATGRDKCW